MFSIPSELLSIASIQSLDNYVQAEVKNIKFVCITKHYTNTSKQYNNQTFKNCEFNSCKFHLCEFKNVVFNRSQLFYVEFDNCTFINCKFCDCLISGTKFVECEFADMHFSESILLGSNICKLSLINGYSSYMQFCMIRHTMLDIDSVNNAKLILKDNMCHKCSVSQRSEQHIFCSITTTNYYLHCPETGSYIAYKKAFTQNKVHTDVCVIVKLQILENAKRSSAGGNKCRASAAKVLSISSINKKKYYKTAYSTYDPDFIYEVGKIVKVTDFDENRWNECTSGIHHFLTRQEAIVY